MLSYLRNCTLHRARRLRNQALFIHHLYPRTSREEKKGTSKRWRKAKEGASLNVRKAAALAATVELDA